VCERGRQVVGHRCGLYCSDLDFASDHGDVIRIAGRMYDTGQWTTKSTTDASGQRTSTGRKCSEISDSRK
jgi:hypothetical protein